MASASKIIKFPSKRIIGVSFVKIFNTYDDLFDICSCSCYENGAARSECRCDERIPVLEWKAFVSQNLRKSQLGSVDIKATAALKGTAREKKMKK